MAKLTLQIELGNEAMQTIGDVLLAVTCSFADAANAHGAGSEAPFHKLTPETDGIDYYIRDENGNTVGGWTVEA